MSNTWRGLAEGWKSLLKRMGFDDYDPAKHYMRGPGPKTRARQGADEQERVGDVDEAAAEHPQEDVR